MRERLMKTMVAFVSPLVLSTAAHATVHAQAEPAVTEASPPPVASESSVPAGPVIESARAAVTDEAAVDAGKKSRAAEADLDRVSQLYLTARKLFGYEHVLLTAVAYSGVRCKNGDSGTFWSCDDAGGRSTRTGIGGLIGVPIVGGGAGHGAFDLWPRFETRSAAEVYLEYQQGAEGWADLLTKMGKSEIVSAEQRRTNLLTAAKALKELLDRAVSPHMDPDDPIIDDDDRDDDEEWPIQLRACVARLIARLEKLDAAADLADFGAEPSVALVARAEGGTDLAKAVEDEARTTAAGAEAVLDGAAEELRGLWGVYKQLSHHSAPQGRHNYLFGPAVILPLQDIASEWFYGFALEAGVPYFRFTLTGGFRSSYDNKYVVAPTGWFAGIGISGEFADDLFHLANGAETAATNLDIALRTKEKP